MTSRDPGKIARAFPSRAQGIMASLKGFDAMVRATVAPTAMAAARDQAQEQSNAVAAEGSSGKTSRRSLSRMPSGLREQLTGVREDTLIQGWGPEVTALAHLCFPPDQYPSGVGPGSQWLCRCRAVWRAEGIAWDAYPTDPSRTAQPLKPEQWFYVEGGQLPAEDYRAQENLYDWRPLGPYYVRLYRAMIDNQLAALGERQPVTWEELG